MKYLTIIIVLLATLGLHASAQSQPSATLLIIEAQTGSADSATEEFVELYNYGPDTILLDGLALQYQSKNGSNWSTKANLTGELPARSRYLLSNYLVEHSQEFNGGLAASAGHLRLAVDDETIDLVAWGEASEPETASMDAHSAGQSLKRKVDEDGYFIDTDNNLEDWFASETPTPSFDSFQGDEPPEEPKDVIDEPEEEESEIFPPETLEPEQPALLNHQLLLNEVMPDPVAPLTDAEHEYVEIVNPNSFDVDLYGYRIESGKDGRYNHELGRYLLRPNEAIAIYSADSGVTLSNSGSMVKLFAPTGLELDSVEYPKARPGLSWSRFGSEWNWGEPTNNANNLRYEDETEQDSNQEVLAAVTTKRDVDFPVQESSGSNQPVQANSEFEEEPTTRTINNWMLAGVGAFALLYGIYEYRHDIGIRVRQLRRHLEVRREARSESQRG